MTGPQIVAANDRVRTFSFANGLFGAGAKSVDDIGIQFPGGKVLGNAQNIKLRFDPTYVSAAAAGQLLIARVPSRMPRLLNLQAARGPSPACSA